MTDIIAMVTGAVVLLCIVTIIVGSIERGARVRGQRAVRDMLARDDEAEAMRELRRAHREARRP